MAPASQSRPTINMPAVVGVVVVVMAIIIAWVVSGQMGSDQVATASTSTTTTTLPGVTTVPTTAPPSTVPDPTTVPTTIARPTVPPSTAVVSDESNRNQAATTTTVATTTTTTAAGGGATGGPGDLGIAGHPIQRPTCDGAFVTVVASAVGDDVSAKSIEGLLDQYPGSEYLRTDRSCPSFTQSQDGQPIYVVYLGPFAQPEDACQARSKGPSGAYVKRLSNDPNAGGAKC